MICHEQKLLPRDIVEPGRMKRLQRDLIRSGQHIPGFALVDEDDLARSANITASSEWQLAMLPADGPVRPLDQPRAQMLPVSKGKMPVCTLTFDVAQATIIEAEVRTSNRPDNHTPDVLLAKRSLPVQAGKKVQVALDFDVTIDEPRYVFVCVKRNEHASLHCSESRVTGLLSVNNFSLQSPPADIDVETFEFWCPERRPSGHNFAFQLNPPLACFAAKNVANGIARPASQSNAWVADPADPAPLLTLSWSKPQTISRIELSFDTDFDHPMESSLLGHPERAVPFCVKACTILNDHGKVLAQVADNHQTRRTVRFKEPVTATGISVRIDGTHGSPASIFEVRCYTS